MGLYCIWNQVFWEQSWCIGVKTFRGNFECGLSLTVLSAMILAVKRNFCNCVWKPEKFRTSTGFEPKHLVHVGSWSFVVSNEPVRNE